MTTETAGPGGLPGTPPDVPSASPGETPPSCAGCGKPPALCICDRVVPLPTRLKVVILQHPREDDALFGTARLLTASLPNAEIRVGLSWGSLEQALGREVERKGGRKGVDRERWAVLSVAKLPAGVPAESLGEPVLLVDRRGNPRNLRRHGLEGIIVLDGTWSQAKSLWWRNPWLLKLPRLALTPREPSLYGQLRREPRREWVSTLEAVADVLPALGEPEEVRTSLRRLLRTLLQRARDHRRNAGGDSAAAS